MAILLNLVKNIVKCSPDSANRFERTEQDAKGRLYNVCEARIDAARREHCRQ